MTRLCSTPVLFLAAAFLAASQTAPPTPELAAALANVSPDSLRGNLSFLASELLEGRDTPSPGLDIAAEFVASCFRRAGLEPVGDDGYLQTAHMLRVEPAAGNFEFHLQRNSTNEAVSRDQVSIISRKRLDIAAPVCKIRDLSAVQCNAVSGKVLELDFPAESLTGHASQIAALKPIAFLQLEDDENAPTPRRLIDPDQERAIFGNIPRVIVRAQKHQMAPLHMLEDAATGETGITLTLRADAPSLTPVTVRNVAGLVRGSDPVLCRQYVLLSAHYDHIGHNHRGIFPGANDDGSGTVSVIEIAQTLAALPVHPKRSILFLTFFGEEEGSLGAHYYAQHPLVPLGQTVADLNLEQLGRTDSGAGTEISNFTLTGFEYSDIPQTLQQAGRLTGIRVYATPNDDPYFSRSDNYVFADLGIPAHTIAVAFDFPDYHGTGDTWQKIDYENMAKVDRAIALGTVMLADSQKIPRWNGANAEAARYEKARALATH